MTNDLDETSLFYKRFKRFDDLPAHHKNLYGAFQWIKAMVSSSGRAFSPHYLQQIPQRFVTDALRKYAISCDVRSLELIDPEDTEQYTQLCLLGYHTHFNAVRYFHEVACTQETVEAMLDEPSNFSRSHQEFPWIAQVMTPAMIERASMASLDFMLTLPDAQISGAALQKYLAPDYFSYTALRAFGKLRLAANYLREGSWPENYSSVGTSRAKPSTIEEAFTFIFNEDLHVFVALYMAYVMTHPTEDVIEHVVSQAHAKLVMEMYGEDQIRPHFTKNQHLKAALLEESLGL
jgi:hypothetical protein